MVCIFIICNFSNTKQFKTQKVGLLPMHWPAWRLHNFAFLHMQLRVEFALSHGEFTQCLYNVGFCIAHQRIYLLRTNVTAIRINAMCKCGGLWTMNDLALKRKLLHLSNYRHAMVVVVKRMSHYSSLDEKKHPRRWKRCSIWIYRWEIRRVIFFGVNFCCF